jgi:hypothetical protein
MGCGRGTFGRLIRTVRPDLFLIGVDVHIEYLNDCGGTYEIKTCADIEKQYIFADAFLFIDVLEHLEQEQAIRLIGNLRREYKTVIASIPNESGGGKHYHQNPDFEAANPHEAHKHDWTNAEVLDKLGLALVGENDGLGVYVSGMRLVE